MRRVDRIWYSGAIAGGSLAAALVTATFGIETVMPPKEAPGTFSLERSAWDELRDGVAPPPELTFVNDASFTELASITEWGPSRPSSIHVTSFEDTGRVQELGTIGTDGRFRLAKGLCPEGDR